MSDLISRAEAIEALKEAFNPSITNFVKAKIAIDNLPSAQPEIIRCKNCKHRHLDGMIWNCPFGLSGGEDFFCAYGAKDGDSDDE